MNFDSFLFLLFFPLVFAGFYLLKQKFKPIWLLLASMLFYLSFKPVYALLLCYCIVLTYFGGRFIQFQNKQFIKKWILAIGIIGLIIPMFVFKYYEFFMYNLLRIGQVFQKDIYFPEYSLLIPLGISFFTFQAISYLVDVYRGQEAQKSFVLLALYISYFPLIMSGPIERSAKMFKQFSKPAPFSYEQVKKGLLMMGYGYCLKWILADRGAVLVNHIFGAYDQYSGAQIVFGVLLFSAQLYFDFAGYSYLAMGVSNVFGIEVGPNFKTPYFSTSIQEFWKSWHISLSSWFRDYVFIPLGGSRVSKIKKYRNILITFIVSGLWHGASWNYVIWGFLHGIYQIIEDVTGFRTKKIPWVLKWMVVNSAVCFAWLFFRAESAKTALIMLKKIVFDLQLPQLLDGGLKALEIQSFDAAIILIGFSIHFLVDYLRYLQKSMIELFEKLPVVIRFTCYLIVAMALFIQFVYNFGKPANQFIYSDF